MTQDGFFQITTQPGAYETESFNKDFQKNFNEKSNFS